MRRLLASTDFLSGTLFLVLGGAFALISFDYEFGTAAQMGAGYFPRFLSFGVVVIGAALIGKSLVHVVSEKDTGTRFRTKPILLVLGSLAVFALLLRPFGLALTTIIMIAVSGFATVDRKVRDIALLALGMSIFAVIVFVELLNVPMPIWPRGL